MKFVKSKLVVATTLALCFSGANAAVINGETVLVNILKDGLTGDSMLIDTQISTSDFVNDAVSTWTANADLTAAISSFLAGTTDAQFWVAGSYKPAVGFDTYALSDTPIADVNAFTTQFGGFVTDANFGVFATATEGLSENWKSGIPALDPSHYVNPALNAYTDGTDLGVDGTFYGSKVGFFGNEDIVYDTWRLDADGTLSYGVSAVPVPAAVWLFGSGLIGLVGVARRRKA